MNTDALLLQLAASPVAARAEAVRVQNSDTTFSNPGEPSNAVKLQHIRDMFDNAEVDAFSPFDLPALTNDKRPGIVQAVSFVCDLRCQVFDRLHEIGQLTETVYLSAYLRNRILHVRARERLHSHILASHLKAHDVVTH